MMNRLFKFFLLLALIMPACKPEIKPIDYGNEKCSHCRMSVVDQRFGCQLVTQKGKIFNFDAVECMIQYLDTQSEGESSEAILVNNSFDKPGELVSVASTTYLVSENMPSPMGAYINPFSEKVMAQENQQKNGGTLYTWDELRKQFTQP